MFSVCIPVYRYNAVPLVQELVRQLASVASEEEGLFYEILIYDDASPNDGDWGRQELRTIPHTNYVELPVNLGRAAIRNRMIRDARSPYCIFLDVDAEIPANYLQSYQNYLGDLHNSSPDWSLGRDLVIVGGRQYEKKRPSNPELHLHWWYGQERESDVFHQSKKSWLGFHSNNFLATRSLLLDHPFPESVDGYGHEDTLWGQQFTGTDVLLYQLNNPVIHLGLETNEVFLRKQHQAIRNLHRLKNETPHLRTRLIDIAERFPRLVRLASYLPENKLKNYLTSRPAPDLRALDLLKLKWWMEEGTGAQGFTL